MASSREVFSEFVRRILRRFCAQNAIAAPADPMLSQLAERLWLLVIERGLPAPLGRADPGEPGEMADAECTALVARVFGETAGAEREKLAVPMRQLVKACFHPEFKVCRDSFREVSPDGSCRRQQLARVKARISGTHCVDCPYWVGLESEAHERFLNREWQPACREALSANLDIFLPEDFRGLRRLLYTEARRSI